MNEIKEFFNYVDYVVATFWGITLYDIAPYLGSGALMSSVDGIVKFLFALVGLIYAIARLINFITMARLNKKFREQEIIEKENSNFYKKFNDEFLNK